jgi:acetate kinase
MSHSYVTGRCAELMRKDISTLKMVSCHIGNGATCCAVDGGKSVDITTGFGTAGGLLMGTRSGDIDPMALFYIARMEGLSFDQLEDLLARRSGFLGLSGVSSDYREVERAERSGNDLAGLALRMQELQIRKFIGAFAFEMGGLDAVIFTAGIGENSARLRRHALEGLEGFGIRLDEKKNTAAAGREAEISAEDSPVRVFVIPTREELAIARETDKAIKAVKP